MSQSSIPDNMPSTKNLIWGIIGEMSRKVDPHKIKGAGEVTIGLLIVAIVFAMATAPFKILLRKNFGSKAISIGEILIGSLFFLFFGALSHNSVIQDGYTVLASVDFTLGDWIYYLRPHVFFIIAYVTLVKGAVDFFKANRRDVEGWEHENYRGQSLLFNRFVTDNKSQYKIWKSVEPGFCLVVGIISIVYLKLLAFPLIFAAIAFGVCEYFHVTYKWERYQEVSNKNAQANTDSFVKDEVVK